LDQAGVRCLAVGASGQAAEGIQNRFGIGPGGRGADQDQPQNPRRYCERLSGDSDFSPGLLRPCNSKKDSSRNFDFDEAGGLPYRPRRSCSANVCRVEAEDPNEVPRVGRRDRA
jgi:hypothetical protein